jgi:hypothetical protein
MLMIIRELMHQHETLLKTDLIMIRADETLSNAQKAESIIRKKKIKMKYQKKRH